jgi:hypothetical protein
MVLLKLLADAASHNLEHGWLSTEQSHQRATGATEPGG